jgi:nitroreductase/NAD-dependent dihydropyrimidine dehydrogenase PreA subunit
MNFINIDHGKCRRDGICVKVCPSQIIVMKEGDTFPSTLEKASELCVHCGHCVSACPHGALVHASIPIESCYPLQRHLRPGPDSIRYFLKSRRSIRNYKSDRVPRKTSADLQDTARFAPTALNKQQVYWTVIEDPNKVKKLSGMTIDFFKEMLQTATDNYVIKRNKRLIAAWNRGKDCILRNAPHLVVVHSSPDLPYSQANCMIALTYLELYAHAKGLGTCWAGYFTTAVNLSLLLRQTLGIPEDHRCFGSVMLGYPQHSYSSIPSRNAPLVTWL